MTDDQCTHRRFNLADGMIVIAALAVTIELGRLTFLAIDDFQRTQYRLGMTAGIRREPVLALLNRLQMLELSVGYLAETIIVKWLLAFAAMRIRRPRPSFRVVAFQPGMVAFWAVASTFIFRFLLDFAGVVPADSRIMPVVMCLAVPLPWGALKLTKRWRSEPSWIDRFGRALGFCWWVITWIICIHIVNAEERYFLP